MTTPLPTSKAQPNEIDATPTRLPRERRLTLFALICAAFFTTSGGAFGLEPLVETGNPATHDPHILCRMITVGTALSPPISV